VAARTAVRQRVCPPEEFDVAVAADANGMANLSPGAATTTKRQLYDDALPADAGHAVARSRELIGELMQAVDYQAVDYKEGSD
jgi:hypothetical protein